MPAAAWPEVSRAAADGRHELTLSGEEVAKRLAERDGHLPAELFGLTKLNFLEVRGGGLGSLPAAVARLDALTALVLADNALELLPAAVGALPKLKQLDVSQNKLGAVPTELGQLSALQTLNLSKNELTSLPDELSALANLVNVNLSFNKLSLFPHCLLDEGLSHLTELNLRANAIDAIPASVGNLATLRVLDLSSNSVVQVPVELACCAKLKELHLRDNSIKDRRLMKLLSDAHPKMHAVLEYIAKNGVRSADGDGRPAAAKTKAQRRAPPPAAAPVDDAPRNRIVVLHFSTASSVTVNKEPSVQGVREHIALCVARQLCLSVDGRLKAFLSLQNKFHDDELLCRKRMVATVATHDLSKLRAPLTYAAVSADELSIVPLRAADAVTAASLVATLTEEAEAVRKKEKRNAYTGVYKYLNLVKGRKCFACVRDADGQTLSMAPITNSETSKIGELTSDVLIEVSSEESLNTCKRIMDKLLMEMLRLGICSQQADGARVKELRVEQVRVNFADNQLYCVYPDRTDLSSQQVDIDVVRQAAD